MLLLYTRNITPRLSYIARFLFGNILRVDYQLTDNSEAFNRHQEAKINYSQDDFEEGIIIRPTELLFEQGIKAREPFVTQWDNARIFFQTDDHSTLPFDIFAASFYLVTRYEEHLPYASDEHGRWLNTIRRSFVIA